MIKKIRAFHNVEIEKHKFHYSKKPINIDKIDID